MLCFCLFVTTALTGAAIAEEGQSLNITESAANVANATIDAAIYLDYAAGIAAGVYKWVLSDDGTYYTLAAVDEAGEPLTAQETAINVGANNEERGGGFPGGGNGHGPQDGFPGNGKGHKGGDFPGMMGGGTGTAGGTVYQGVYMNANITNLENQTMLVYVPAAYMAMDSEGNVTGIDHEAVINGYTADTAPIVYLNECGGWRSSSPRAVDVQNDIVSGQQGHNSRPARDTIPGQKLS